ncbi:MAG: hypothetical protein QOJ15_8461 [Bradyrhizobium sp.]|nr:hypothetical protein [Bradyrhizobium sp.]
MLICPLTRHRAERALEVLEGPDFDREKCQSKRSTALLASSRVSPRKKFQRLYPPGKHADRSTTSLSSAKIHSRTALA